MVLRMDDFGSVVGTSETLFTIEIYAIIKFYDRICVCYECDFSIRYT